MNIGFYLTNVKEVVDLLEEVNIDFPEDVVIYYIVKNLLHQYEICKRMILDYDRLPSYEDLESKLINIEMSSWLDPGSKRTSEVMFTHRGRDSHTLGPPRVQGHLSNSFQGSYNQRPNFGYQQYLQYQPQPLQQSQRPTYPQQRPMFGQQ